MPSERYIHVRRHIKKTNFLVPVRCLVNITHISVCCDEQTAFVLQQTREAILHFEIVDLTVPSYDHCTDLIEQGQSTIMFQSNVSLVLLLYYVIGMFRERFHFLCRGWQNLSIPKDIHT